MVAIIKNKKTIILISLIIFIFCINIASANNETDISDDAQITDDTQVEEVTVEKTDDSKKNTIIFTDNQLSRPASDTKAGEKGSTFNAMLLDENGKVLSNKTVQVAVNGKISNLTTDSFGRVPIQLTSANANVYTYVFAFSGDDDYYASSVAPIKVTITKKTTSISASSKTFKSQAKTKQVTVTLKTTKNPVNGKTYLSSGKKLTLKVNGKTYTGKTNTKNQVKFKIKLTKKGKYTARINFAGDKTYASSSKTVKITLK